MMTEQPQFPTELWSKMAVGVWCTWRTTVTGASRFIAGIAVMFLAVAATAAAAPTDLGVTVNELLVESFPRILDIEFTARMEEQLDEVEESKLDWQKVLEDFYGPFEDSLATAAQQMRNVKKEGIPTEEVCEKCGKPMVIRWGRYGKFMACSGYPDCRNTKEVGDGSGASAEEAEQLAAGKTCPACGSPMVVKTGRTGRFLSCKKYPECKTALPLGIGVDCPEPGSIGRASWRERV